MSDQPKPPTKLDYYDYLVRLNKLLSDVRLFHTEVASSLNTGTGRIDEVKEHLNAIRCLIADTIAMAVEDRPGA